MSEGYHDEDWIDLTTDIFSCLSYTFRRIYGNFTVVSFRKYVVKQSFGFPGD